MTALNLLFTRLNKRCGLLTRCEKVGPFGYRLNTSKKQTNYLSNFTENPKAIVVQRYTVITNFTEIYVCGFCVSTRGETPHGVFADAAEVERAVSFDDVGDLGVAIRGVVLEVVDDTPLGIKTEDK